MSLTFEDSQLAAIPSTSYRQGRHRRTGPTSENAWRRLVPHTWVLTNRILRRWSRDPATVFESLVIPIVLLVTLDIVLGDAISQVTGHSALYGSVPLVAMVGAMTGGMIGGIGLMGERTAGLLSRLWVLPVHRASGLLARLAADVVRIVVLTACILCTGLLLGFRFRQGLLESVAWLFIPACLGLAFSAIVITIALYAPSTIMVEATEVIWAALMFFSTGFMPLEQYPELDSAGRPASAGELCGRCDARFVHRWSGVGTACRNAALDRRHRRRMRDTDGDRLSKGQQAWLISCSQIHQGV